MVEREGESIRAGIGGGKGVRGVQRHGSRRGVGLLLLGVALAWLGAPGGAAASPSLSLVFTGTSGAGAPGGAAIEAQVGDLLTVDVVVANPDPAGLIFVSHSLAYDPAVLQVVSAEECPSPPNLFAGVCTPSGAVFLNSWGNGAAPGSSAASAVGDIDLDGKVGAADHALMWPWTGFTVPPAPPAVDLNGDLFVSAADGATFAGSWGFPGSPGLLPGRVELLQVGVPLGVSPWQGDLTLARVVFEVIAPGSSDIEVDFVAGIDGVVDGNGTLLADGANPSGIPITNAVVNPTSVPGLPAWGVLPLSVALAGAALAARRRRG